MSIDYGPLSGFIGTWTGDQGMDLSPEPGGDEQAAYYERLEFEPAGDVDNADSQDLVMLRYNQVVMRKRNDKVFHNEAGFLIWCEEESLVMQSFAIPRGFALVAGGTAELSGDSVTINLRAAAGDELWPISQSPFLLNNARTSGFSRTYVLRAGTLTYQQSTELEIYGRKMAHTDTNSLTQA